MKNNKSNGWVWNMTLILLLAFVLTAATGGLADEETATSVMEYGISGTWDSRYVTEGRDNLDGDTLAGITIEAACKGLSLGAWYVSSPDADYREFDAGATYNVELNDIEAYASFTHLCFLTDEEDDNELGAGFSYSGLPVGLAIGIDGYYSFEAEGAFLEASISGEFDVWGRLTLVPSAVLGWNSGYIADGHNGANHVALSLEASAPLKDGLDFVVYAAYSWAIDADFDRYSGDENLKDFPYVGVVLHAAF